MAFDFPNSPAINDLYVAGPDLVYKWNGEVWLVDSGTVPLAIARRVITYAGAGTYQYVKPAGLKDIVIELWGAGGGGGAAAATAAGQQAAGAGGGAGGYTRKLYQASELGASEPLVLAAGGAAGVSGTNNGITPANSTFKSLIAGGGAGGPNGVATTTFISVGNVASGNGTGGDFNGRGGYSQHGGPFFMGTINFQQSAGGAAYGRAVSGGAVAGTGNPGASGSAGGEGCGGTSAFNGQSVAAKAGGNGGDGFAIITETYWDTDTYATTPLISTVKTTVISAVGVSVWTKPTALKFLQIELWGCGGGGGGAIATGAAQASVGCGGGGGGYVRHFVAAADVPATLDVTLGTRGTGGTGVAGGVGGTSTIVGGSVSLSASGGAGGQSSGLVSSFPTGYGGVAYGAGGFGGNVLNGRGGYSGPASFFAASTILNGLSGNSFGSNGLPSTGNANGTDCGTEDIGIGGGASLNNASQAVRRGGHGGFARAIFTEYY